MSNIKGVSTKQLERYPIYLKYLLSIKETGITKVSSPMIAKALESTEEQVRKDLQVISKNQGKPREGRDINELIQDIENFLGYYKVSDAVIIGVGHLGEAFIKYDGFKSFGLNIFAGFDNSPKMIGHIIEGKRVYDIREAEDLIPKMNVQIAIITTPGSVSQEIADMLVRSGIKAIWNFAPVHLQVPDDVVVEHVNLASSLAVLSHKLKVKQEKENN